MLARKLLWIVPALIALPLQAQDLQVVELGECALESGEVLAPCDLGYRTYGELNAARDNAILISTWFGGNSAAWTGILGSGLIDLEGFYTIVVDAFGNGVSTSPTTSPTQGGEAFPLVSIGDMVHSQYRLVTDVQRGENRGRTLKHTAVARTLTVVGTLELQDDTWAATASIPLAPTWKVSNLRVIGFVQERRSRHIIGAGSASVDSR